MPETFPRYHPIELSEPDYEHEEVRHLTFYSEALGGRGDVSLFVPPEALGQTGIPIVLLLHGVYGSHWSWFYSGGAHRTARRLMDAGTIQPVIVVTPSDGLVGDGSGYYPQPSRDYEAWIVEDVLGCIRGLFPCTLAGNTFIGGLSMGGYGALRLGAKYADHFQGISAHSAITKPEELDDFLREPLDRTCFVPEEGDLLYWMNLNRKKLPPIRFDCGTEDHLFRPNQLLHEALEREGISHQFAANPGSHSWKYWKIYVAESLLFFDSILKANS